MDLAWPVRFPQNLAKAEIVKPWIYLMKRVQNTMSPIGKERVCVSLNPSRNESYSLLEIPLLLCSPLGVILSLGFFLGIRSWWRCLEGSFFHIVIARHALRNGSDPDMLVRA